ncbi:MAG: hypothetical protein MUC38_03735 [Cyclobacteriaceae bacterium]|nr:hypothetical protein [Cyclobacteriaceae bacterium]
MKTCPTGKRTYATATLAEDALLEAHAEYAYAPGQGPIAIYLCEECGNYHFTSRAPMNERLKQALENGQLRTQQLARPWTRKWK